MTIVNTDQAEHWNAGDGVAHWVRNQDRYDRMNAPFAAMILDAAGLRPGTDVLDVGCGCGGTTLAAARLVAPGQAVGLDLSGPMLARARAGAEAAGLGNAEFRQGDAQVHPLEPGRFGAVLSRFGVMFFADPVAAFANLARALRPGGRLAFVCWRRPDENPIMMEPVAAAIAAGLPQPEPGPPHAPGPFAFADRERVSGILAAAGFTEIAIAAHDESIGGNDLEAALDLAFQVGPLGRMVRDKPAERAAVTGAVRAVLARHVVAGGVVLMQSATWIATAKRA
jgi:SAM-dependent methyltransferase